MKQHGGDGVFQDGSISQLIQHLLSALYHRHWNTSETCRFDAVAAAGSARPHLVQEEQIVARFFNHHLKVGHVLAFASQGVELVIVRSEHGAGLDVAGQMFTHGPSD